MGMFVQVFLVLYLSLFLIKTILLAREMYYVVTLAVISESGKKGLKDRKGFWIKYVSYMIGGTVATFFLLIPALVAERLDFFKVLSKQEIENVYRKM